MMFLYSCFIDSGKNSKRKAQEEIHAGAMLVHTELYIQMLKASKVSRDCLNVCPTLTVPIHHYRGFLYSTKKP